MTVLMGRRMPRQKRGESRQDYETSVEFLRAVERRFGAITFDLAAARGRSVRGLPFFGPGSPLATDAFTAEWPTEGVNWLNPPFDNIARWAAACAARVGSGASARILFLVPAAVGSNWWQNYCWPQASTHALNPRIKFVGEKNGYPKDLILCLFGHGRKTFTPWRWDRE